MARDLQMRPQAQGVELRRAARVVCVVSQDGNVATAVAAAAAAAAAGDLCHASVVHGTHQMCVVDPCYQSLMDK